MLLVRVLRNAGRGLEQGAGGLVALILAAIVFVGSIIGLMYTSTVEADRLEHGTQTIARVIGSSGKNTIVLEFETANGTKSIYLDSATWNLAERDLAPGANVAIVYKTGDPQQVWLMGQRGDTKGWLGYALGALIIGVFGLAGHLQRKSGRSGRVEREEGD